LRSGFSYFCRSCYKILVGRLQITESDFINYLNLSFKTKLTLAGHRAPQGRRKGIALAGTFPPDWRFPDIHYWIWCRNPSIKPLAVILESLAGHRAPQRATPSAGSIVFLKMALSGRNIFTRKLQLVKIIL
jgi:hypothetical protein